MATDTESDLLTIAETAKILKVSVVTLHRWLKQGRLPAYKLGPRYVRIRRSELAKMLTPVGREAGSTVQTSPMETQVTLRRLTEDEVKRRLNAIEEAKEFREELVARRGGKPFAPSWPLIREAREERSKQR